MPGRPGPQFLGQKTQEKTPKNRKKHHFLAIFAKTLAPPRKIEKWQISRAKNTGFFGFLRTPPKSQSVRPPLFGPPKSDIFGPPETLDPDTPKKRPSTRKSGSQRSTTSRISKRVPWKSGRSKVQRFRDPRFQWWVGILFCWAWGFGSGGLGFMGSCGRAPWSAPVSR